VRYSVVVDGEGEGKASKRDCGSGWLRDPLRRQLPQLLGLVGVGIAALPPPLTRHTLEREPTGPLVLPIYPLQYRVKMRSKQRVA